MLVPLQAEQKTNALHAAVSGGHIAVVSLLLEAGADVSAAFARAKAGKAWRPVNNDRMSTALDVAADSGQEAVVRMLVEAMQDRKVWLL